jgi:hypothetical protein
MQRRIHFMMMAAILLLAACGEEKKSENKGLEVSAFNPITNFEGADSLVLSMDLTGVINEGIQMPSVKQAKDGEFQFSFKLKNGTGKQQPFVYKIYYQNESYKYHEAEKKGYNPLASENFYGSWESASEGFRNTNSMPSGMSATVTDGFKIEGNPRNESIYYGADPNAFELTQDTINETMRKVRETGEWYNSVVKKAKERSFSIDAMVYEDAMWAINRKRKRGNINNKWKRNPRVGKYSFLLVVTTEEQLKQIPHYIQDVSQCTADSLYINPYYYFLYGNGSKMKDVFVLQSNKHLYAKAKLDVNTGIFVDLFKFKRQIPDTNCFSSSCNTSKELYNNAHYEQFFHEISKSTVIQHVKDTADVAEGNYTMAAYKANERLGNSQLVDDYIKVTDCPCKTVGHDAEKGTIYLNNPGGDGMPRKENTGIATRIGFTYGKFRAKIKFPKLLSNENVWNGLTCAFWLLHQEKHPWNNRRICAKEGYTPKGGNRTRIPNTHYSEIDFEIIKASRFWPKTSYPAKETPPWEIPEENKDIIVSCTNWDLACPEPENYNIGAHWFTEEGTTYEMHRWDHWYQAITSKHSANHDELFDTDYYYFEIDWQPNKIIWRIGPEKDNMRVINVMDNTITNIPNNQMIMLMTQEFHQSHWWPTTPFKQERIPYPAKNITGELYEIEIE